MTLEEKIKFLLDKGFSCNQISKICDCHVTTITKWLRGEIQISNKMKSSIENHIQSFIKELEQIWM